MSRHVNTVSLASATKRVNEAKRSATLKTAIAMVTFWVLLTQFKKP